MGRVQVVLHNQDNREHDLLDSDDYYRSRAASVPRWKRFQEHGRNFGSETIPAPNVLACSGSKRNWTR